MNDRKQPACDLCGQEISEDERDFCLANNRFNGQVSGTPPAHPGILPEMFPIPCTIKNLAIQVGTGLVADF